MKKSRKKVKFYTLDKFMITLIVLLVVAMPVLIVYSKSTLSESNIELERIKRKIEKM